EFPQDSAVDGVNGDMILETLLNEILLGLEEMNLQNFIKVPILFDVVCAEKKLAENERPILEQTADVVTPPSDHIMNLSPVPLNQVVRLMLFLLPLMLGRGLRRRLLPESLLPKIGKAGEFVGGISSAAPKGLVVKGKKPATPRKPLLKKGKLVICPPKSVMGESAKGSSKTSGSTHSEPLVSARPGPRSAPVAHHISGIIFDLVEDSAETPREDQFYSSMSEDPFIDHLATPWQFSSLRSLSHQDVCDHANVAATRYITFFSKIRLRLEHAELARGKLERSLIRRDAALDKRDAKVERLQKFLNEKPYEEMARLRLGFDGASRDILRLRKQVEDLKVEADKVPGLLASYSQKEIDLSTLTTKYQDLLREKEQVELRNASLRGQVDGEMKVKAEFDRRLEAQQRRLDECVAMLDARLDKMAKETDEEFAHMLRDAKKTKEFLVGKGFRYFLNKFKESDILGSHLGACISAAISDGMRQGLDARFVEACVEQPFSYLEDLLFMGVDESIQDEAGTSTNPASGETSSAGGGAEQFIIAPSVPYAGDAGSTTTRLTPVQEVPTVESDSDVLTGTAPNDNAATTLSFTPDVLNSDPATMVIPTSRIFE
ncbi:hypothetical protein Tco_0180840, partial [Tanacetum coccineum]